MSRSSTGFAGPNLAIVTACTTGLHCIGEAGRIIEYGDADVMIAGGAEATVSPLGIGGFAAARALSTRNDDPATASRPWDRDRDGFVLGEGAGVVVLEEYEHAKRRGARIYAELIGFGMGADAFHMTAPNVDGPKRSMTAALRNASINADQVQYLNAHGTSTPLGDLNESNAIKLAFGDAASGLAISSTKSMTGHLLGGAGGVEAVFTVLALHHQVAPPTINIFNQDPACDLDFCANTAREMKIELCAEEQLRLRRHQRQPGIQALLTSAPTPLRRAAAVPPPSPVVEFDLPRRHGLGALAGGLATLGSASLIGWWFGAVPAIDEAGRIALAAAALATVGCALGSARRDPACRLRHDGRNWALASGVDPAAIWLDGEMRVVFDLQSAMLLRFEPVAGRWPVRVRWLALRRHDLGARWHEWRCAVHASIRSRRHGAPSNGAETTG